jgi:hypothetical protein
VIAQVEPAGMMPAFSGGTSLSKGWELIKRFSEDIDFKVGEPAAASLSAGQRARSHYRRRTFDALTGAGFRLEGAPEVKNDRRWWHLNPRWSRRSNSRAHVGGGHGRCGPGRGEGSPDRSDRQLRRHVALEGLGDGA